MIDDPRPRSEEAIEAICAIGRQSLHDDFCDDIARAYLEYMGEQTLGGVKIKEIVDCYKSGKCDFSLDLLSTS